MYYYVSTTKHQEQKSVPYALIVVRYCVLVNRFRAYLRTFVVLHKKGYLCMSDLYETIRDLCKRNGISVSAMCLNLGMSKSTMSDLKSGRKRSLSAETLSRIAQYLGVSVDYLLTGEEKENPLVNDDEELTEYLEELKNRPEKRMLFSVTKNATKAQIEAIVKMIEEMQGN